MVSLRRNRVYVVVQNAKYHRTESSRYEGTVLVLIQDCVLSVVASLLAILLVRWLSEPEPGFSARVLLWLGVALAGTLAGALVSGSYKAVRRWATLSSVSRLIGTVTLKEAVMAAVVLTGLVPMPSTALAVVALLTDVLLTYSLLLYIRFAARMFGRSEVKKVKAEASRMNALVQGTDTAAVEMANELSGTYNVVGFLTDEPEMSGRVIADVIVYYCKDAREREALEWRLGGVDCIFFPKRAPGATPASAASGPEAVVPDGMSRSGQLVKRSFDIVLSGLLLIVFSPLAALSALAVKLEDGGDVLYRQERVGKDGRVFNILKFRSMRMDAERHGAQLYAGDADPRLTRVGAFLRKHHLDELPQLWNVLRGDMSFIGYRPERQYYIDQIMEHNPRYRYLYQIRPGVTSYATLYNGYTDTMEKMLTRLDLDLYYLRHHSVLFDARVLGLTFLSIVFGKEF